MTLRILEGEGLQHVLKAKPATADATDRSLTHVGAPTPPRRMSAAAGWRVER